VTRSFESWDDAVRFAELVGRYPHTSAVCPVEARFIVVFPACEARPELVAATFGRVS
jgi:hypothetical protein